MSSGSFGQREWRFFLADMLEFADKIQRYTQDIDQREFEENSLIYDAVLRNIELIGEAAKHIPEEFRASVDEIPWRQLIATRNRITHAYLGIDNDTIWSIVADDIPSLRTSLNAIIDAH